MRDQITVRLPAELNRALRRMSRQLRRKNSDVVRLALEAFLQRGEQTGQRPSERVGPLIGSLASGVPDLVERHRSLTIVGGRGVNPGIDLDDSASLLAAMESHRGPA